MDESGKLKDTAEKIRDSLSDFGELDVEKWKATASQLAEEAAEIVKKHPLASVAGAFAAGVLLGTLLGRRK